MFKNNNHEFLYYLRHNRGTYNTNKLKFAMSIATKCAVQLIERL